MAISQITANSIADGTVVASDIADGTITDAKIVGVANTKITGVLGTSQIANSAITADKIAPGAVVTFDSGTVMIFGQNTAPTGWTKDTTNFHNSSLRVVTGNIASGGTVDFTTAFASQTPTGSVSITAVSGSAGATTLTTPQIPSHTHTYDAASAGNVGGQSSGIARTTGVATGAQGGDASHTHPFSFSSGSGTFSGNAINLAVKYVDVIRATKN
jgi:hypothetical protein